jgi:hypothetical protein
MLCVLVMLIQYMNIMDKSYFFFFWWVFWFVYRVCPEFITLYTPASDNAVTASSQAQCKVTGPP